MVGLGEMAAYLPHSKGWLRSDWVKCAYLRHSKGFAGYATRFVDPALGCCWRYD
jgi:amino acid permease